LPHLLRYCLVDLYLVVAQSAETMHMPQVFEEPRVRWHPSVCSV
jgi:hypothetical protein